MLLLYWYASFWGIKRSAEKNQVWYIPLFSGIHTTFAAAAKRGPGGPEEGPERGWGPEGCLGVLNGTGWVPYGMQRHEWVDMNKDGQEGSR